MAMEDEGWMGGWHDMVRWYRWEINEWKKEAFLLEFEELKEDGVYTIILRLALLETLKEVSSLLNFFSTFISEFWRNENVK